MFTLINYKYKNLFWKSHVDKQLKIKTDDGLLMFTNKEIEWENFELTESLCSESELRFGSCEASILKFRIFNNFIPLTGKWLTVTETLEGNKKTPFQFGRYKVFSDVPTADRLYRDVTAYDAMYDIINSSAINWYNNIFPNKDSKVTMRQFRTSFIESFGLQQEEITLVNDDLILEKTLEVGEGTEIDNETEQVSIIKESSLSGLNVIKAICEINGCFGHIGRDGKFHYIYLKQDIMGLYPSNTLFPDRAPDYLPQAETGHLYPQDPKSTSLDTGKQISGNYEDFLCKKINRVQVRQEENDIGGQYPEGKIENENRYVIEDNFLVYGKSANDLRNIAKNILDRITNIIYRPFSFECVGNPCLEVGDAVRLPTKYELIESYILNRTLKGIQSLRDSYSALGQEKYSEKVNSVSKSIIQLKGKTNTLVRNVEETKSEIKDVEAGLTSTITQTATDIRTEIKNTKEGLESSITQNANNITAEVKRATEKEGELSGKISINADNITAEVARAKGEEGSLSSRITINENGILQRVEKGSVSSEISQEAGQVKIRSNRLMVESSQFKLDEYGNATFSGNLQAATGNFYGSIISDNNSYFAKIENAALQGGRSGSSETGYIGFNAIDTKTGTHGTSIGGRGIIALFSPKIGVGDWKGVYEDGAVWGGQSDSTSIVTSIWDNGDGTIGWKTKTIAFEKGIMISEIPDD